MMIKRYLQFINESDQFNLGLYLTEPTQDGSCLCDDEYVMNIINRYINDNQELYGGEDINQDIDLENAINLLDDRIKLEIKQQIDEYLEMGIVEKEPQIHPSTDTTELLGESVQAQSEISVAGKGIFTSFLKSLTALGQKECQPNWNLCPDEFLLYYYFPDLESEVVKQIFSRFKSLTRYLHLVDYQQNNLNLYFGVNTSGQFEYGIQYEQRFPIGQFKLSQSIIKWLLSLESKSAQSLKKEIVNLNYSDLLTLGQIKRDMMTFQPGYFEKRLSPMLRDRVITFGFYGVGRWDNGKLDEGEYQNLKQNFTNWLMSKKWGSKVLISVKPESFWLYFHLKLK
jgi:hypothetical protein